MSLKKFGTCSVQVETLSHFSLSNTHFSRLLSFASLVSSPRLLNFIHHLSFPSHLFRFFLLSNTHSHQHDQLLHLVDELALRNSPTRATGNKFFYVFQFHLSSSVLFFLLFEFGQIRDCDFVVGFGDWDFLVQIRDCDLVVRFGDWDFVV